jgi:hypothetical protein
MNRFDADADDELRALKSAARAERRALEDAALDDDPVYGELDAREQAALTRGVLERVTRAQPRRLRPLVSYTLAGLAAAAAALLVMWPRAESLPAYTLVPPAGDALVRDEGAERATTYAVGRELELLFRPATASAVRPELSCFVRTGARWQRFLPEVELSPEGALRARLRSGPGGNLPVGAGEHELLCLLVREGTRTSGRPQLEAGPGVQRFELPLTLVD